MSKVEPSTMVLCALRAASLVFGLLALGSCEGRQLPAPGGTNAASAPPAQASVQREQKQVWMTVRDRRFAISLEDNEAARAFAAMLPVTLDMPDFNSNEKHVELSQALPTNASQPRTIHRGDLMLYGSRTLVLFYLTFDTPYSYTRLGRVNDPTGLAQTLGRGSARITFSRN